MLDLRKPIGILFTMLGVLLAGYGVVTNGNTAMYQMSLGHNLNLLTGIGMLVFGVSMLAAPFLLKPDEEAPREELSSVVASEANKTAS